MCETVLESRQNERRNGRVQDDPNLRTRRCIHFPAMMLAAELDRTDVASDFAGSEILDGRILHHLRLHRVSTGTEVDEKLTRDSELDVYVDAETFLIRKVSYTRLSLTDWRRGLLVEVFYDDYRSISGILVPFRQRMLMAGLPLQDWTVTAVTLNVGLPDSEFEVR